MSNSVMITVTIIKDWCPNFLQSLQKKITLFYMQLEDAQKKQSNKFTIEQTCIHFSHKINFQNILHSKLIHKILTSGL